VNNVNAERGWPPRDGHGSQCFPFSGSGEAHHKQVMGPTFAEDHDMPRVLEFEIYNLHIKQRDEHKAYWFSLYWRRPSVLYTCLVSRALFSSRQKLKGLTLMEFQEDSLRPYHAPTQDGLGPT